MINVLDLVNLCFFLLLMDEKGGVDNLDAGSLCEEETLKKVTGAMTEESSKISLKNISIRLCIIFPLASSHFLYVHRLELSDLTYQQSVTRDLIWYYYSCGILRHDFVNIIVKHGPSLSFSVTQKLSIQTFRSVKWQVHFQCTV